MPRNFKVALISAMIYGLSGMAFGNAAPPSAKALAGQYAMGEEPNLIFLSLLPEGKFVMRSRRPLGDQIGGQVKGEWVLKSSELVLRSTMPGHPFSWLLRVAPQANGFDLVPAELADLYRQEPFNHSTHYRRYGGPSADDERMLTQASATNQPEADNRTAASPPTVHGAAKSGKGNEKAHKTPAKVRGSLHPPQETSRPRPSISDKREAAVFIYQPGPTEPMDARSLRAPGLARLSTDARGNVTSVTILQSTGQRQFDAEAADILRRWRVQAGPAREIDVPLTSVLNGKRAPVRIPLNAGSMTSG